MPNSKKALSDYRLSAAEEHLDSARLLLDAGKYKDSIGRSYYAIFASVRALLALDEVDFSKHAGVISYFQREYIKSRQIDPKYSKYLGQAFQIRNNADYQDFFVVSAADAKEQYDNAVDFLNMIKSFIAKRS